MISVCRSPGSHSTTNLHVCLFHRDSACASICVRKDWVTGRSPVTAARRRSLPLLCPWPSRASSSFRSSLSLSYSPLLSTVSPLSWLQIIKSLIQSFVLAIGVRFGAEHKKQAKKFPNHLQSQFGIILDVMSCGSMGFLAVVS
uniref:Uncharacterized protein n=1 Tax=Zea mays TaxID=4577 RepID=A0A804RJR9_MAIZE